MKVESRIIGANSWRENNLFHLNKKLSNKQRWKDFHVTLFKHFLLKRGARIACREQGLPFEISACQILEWN